MCKYSHIMDLGPIANSSQLGAAIRAARERAGMTQQELADRAGTSRRWLVMLESGASTGAELGKTLAALDVLGITMRLATRERTTGTVESDLLDLLDQEGL
jgi:transcriptional regulator with XRE-family HTH domain